VREEIDAPGAIERRLDDLLADFGVRRLTEVGSARVEERLRGVGVGVDPPLGQAMPQDEVQLFLAPPEDLASTAPRVDRRAEPAPEDRSAAARRSAGRATRSRPAEPPPRLRAPERENLETEAPRPAATWRIEALLASHGSREASLAAREAVEEALRGEGLAADPPLAKAPPQHGRVALSARA
jgi:hypothetical protein